MSERSNNRIHERPPLLPTYSIPVRENQDSYTILVDTVSSEMKSILTAHKQRGKEG